VRKTTLFGLAVVGLALAWLAQAAAQTPSKEFVITIEDLDCPTCAKKVEKAVAAVSGVSAVKTDVEKQTATVTPQAEKGPSARALWEAVEKAGFRPTKLVGPGGTFTTKPSA
jgi:copper chaperone CopZ